MSADCLPFPREPRNVEELNDVVRGYREVEAFRGGDVGASVVLSDGRQLWVFGDTLRAADFPGQRYVRNSMLVFGEGCATVIVPPDHGAIIPDRPDGVGYWPMSIAMVPGEGHDLVGVLGQRVAGSDIAAEFTNLGPSIAIFRVEPGGWPELVEVSDLGPDLADRSRPTWGAATWLGDDGWAYVYGTSNPETEFTFGWALHVARVRPVHVLEPDAWQYWDGNRWQHDPERAAELIPPVGGVSQTLSVLERDGTWYAVSKRDDFLGDDLVVWSAPAPTGPFTAGEPVAQIPSDLDRRIYRYMPLAHPHLPASAGNLVVAYSQNTDDLDLLERDPLLYRPQFLEIPLD